MAKKALTANDVHAMLRSRYTGDDYAYFEEVRNSTGYVRGERYADAIAMSLWPSRGLDLEGFEIKVSRGDVLKELKDPAKSAAIQKYCDRWWLVVSDLELIDPSTELPSTWGLMVPRGNKIVVKVAAPKLEASPIDKGFLASLFRQWSNASTDTGIMKSRIDLAWRKGKEVGEKNAKSNTKWDAKRVEQIERELELLRGKIKTFEKETGLRFGYHLPEMDEIVKAIKAVRDNTNLKRLLNQSRRSIEILQKSVEAFEALAEEQQNDDDSEQGQQGLDASPT